MPLKSRKKIPLKIIKLCKRFKIKITKKVGKKRIYRKLSILKKLIKNKLKKSKNKRKSKSKRKRNSFGGIGVRTLPSSALTTKMFPNKNDILEFLEDMNVWYSEINEKTAKKIVGSGFHTLAVYNIPNPPRNTRHLGKFIEFFDCMHDTAVLKNIMGYRPSLEPIYYKIKDMDSPLDRLKTFFYFYFKFGLDEDKLINELIDQIRIVKAYENINQGNSDVLQIYLRNIKDARLRERAKDARIAQARHDRAEQQRYAFAIEHPELNLQGPGGR